MHDDFDIRLDDWDDWEILLVHSDPHPQHLIEYDWGGPVHYMESHS